MRVRPDKQRYSGWLLTLAAILTLPLTVSAQTQVSPATQACQEQILLEGGNLVRSRVKALSKCLNGVTECKILSGAAERNSCIAKLLVPSKGDCAEGRLDAGNPTIGEGAAAASLGKNAALDSALASLVSGLESRCFGPAPADLSSIAGGLGFPSGLTNAVALADELNGVPYGLGCLSLEQFVASAPRAQELVDELRALNLKCVKVKSTHVNLFLTDCTSDANCGPSGACGRIAQALATPNIQCATECAAGSVRAGSSCAPCVPGYFSNDPAAAACTACRVGTATANYGSTACAPCAPGSFSNSGAAASCTSCAPGTFAPAAGGTTCLHCQPNTVSNPARTACVCDAGFINDPVGGNLTCQQCPEGADCLDPGTTWQNVLPLGGWFRSGDVFYRCLVAAQCPGR